MISLNRLYYFQQIAKEESISRAASSLFVSQSALSKSLHELEEELDCRLFERHGKRLILNDDGRYFLKLADELLAEAEALREKMAARKKAVRYFVVDSQYHELASLIYSLAQKYFPDVRFVFRNTQTDNLTKISMLAEGKINLSMVSLDDREYIRLTGLLQENSIKALLVMKDRLYLSAPDVPPYDTMERCSLKDIPSVPLAKNTSEYYYDVALFERLCAARKIRPQYQYELDSEVFNSIWPKLEIPFVTSLFYINHRDYHSGYMQRHQIMINDPGTQWGVYLLFRDEKEGEIRGFVDSFRNQIYDDLFEQEEGI